MDSLRNGLRIHVIPVSRPTWLTDNVKSKLKELWLEVAKQCTRSNDAGSTYTSLALNATAFIVSCHPKCNRVSEKVRRATAGHKGALAVFSRDLRALSSEQPLDAVAAATHTFTGCIESPRSVTRITNVAPNPGL